MLGERVEDNKNEKSMAMDIREGKITCASMCRYG